MNDAIWNWNQTCNPILEYVPTLLEPSCSDRYIFGICIGALAVIEKLDNGHLKMDKNNIKTSNLKLKQGKRKAFVPVCGPVDRKCNIQMNLDPELSCRDTKW